MTYLLGLDGDDHHNTRPCAPVGMAELGLREKEHLERWLSDHPEALGEDLKIVATQYSHWSSEVDQARKRPDIIALSSSGELVVIELKRGADPEIHLQAITYAALCSSFDADKLAEAHADWVTGRRLAADPGAEPMSADKARKDLVEHTEEGILKENRFLRPRILLVAEDFGAETLTTVQWLQLVAEDLTVECHEYRIFDLGAGAPGEPAGARHVVSFRRVFPVDDVAQRRLRPGRGDLAGDAAGIRSSKRRAKAVSIIHERGLIPDGAPLELRLDSLGSAESRAVVKRWLEADPDRSAFSWHPHPMYPLRWRLHPGREYTPTSLRNAIFEEAGVGGQGSFAATLAFFHEGQNLDQLSRDSDEEPAR